MGYNGQLTGQEIDLLPGQMDSLSQQVRGIVSSMCYVSDYITEGSVMPYAAFYAWSEKFPICHCRIINTYLNEWQMIFCSDHTDGNEASSLGYYVFTTYEDGWHFDGTYDANNAPEWLLRAFSANLAGKGFDGLMSAEDKEKLDNLPKIASLSSTLDSKANKNDVYVKAVVDELINAEKKRAQTEEGKKIDKESIVQTIGDSQTDVMSQKAVTDKLNAKLDKANLADELGNDSNKAISQRAVKITNDNLKKITRGDETADGFDVKQEGFHHKKFPWSENVLSDVNIYLDSIHGNASASVRIGFSVLDIGGRQVILFSTPLSYAKDMWSQTIIGAVKPDRTGLKLSAFSDETVILARECEGGSWKTWKLIGGYSEATVTSSGLMSANDKAKLDALSLSDNNGTIDADILSGYLLTDAVYVSNVSGASATIQQTNGGAAILNLPIVSDTENGLMSADDKVKLDGVPADIATQVYNRDIIGLVPAPSTNDVRITIGQRENSRHGTIPAATTTLAGVMTAADKAKLEAAARATQYIEGKKEVIALMESEALLSLDVGGHDANRMQITATRRDGQTLTVDIDPANEGEAGVMTAEDKRNLDYAMDNILGGTDVSVEPDYVQIDVHGPVREDGSFESYEGIIPGATQEKAGVMTAEDKAKLNKIVPSQIPNGMQLGFASEYISMALTGRTSDGETVPITEEYMLPVATEESIGLMTAEDKVKLGYIRGDVYTKTEVDNALKAIIALINDLNSKITG